MASNCNKYLEPTGVVLGKSTRVLGKVTLTTDGTYDSTKEYDRISLVYDPNTYISYISKQHVPAGTALSNTEYWQPLNSAILGPGQSLSGILNMLNSLDLPNVSGFLHYNEDNNSLEWVDVEQLIEIINNSGLELSLNEPLKSINSLNTSATQAGQMLIYNGTQWKLDKVANIPQALGEPLKSIATLGTPSGTNKVIVYKNGSWSYQDASSMNLGSLLTHINTKNAPVPTTSGYLYYNGNNYSWAAGTGGNTELGTLLTALKNTNYPPANPAFLYYNGYGFTWYNSNVVVKWADIQNKPITLSGYGITANDTLLTNLSGRITSLENKVPVTLHEPILSINNINSNPATVGSILVYRENGWQYEAKPSGGTPGQTSYDDTWIYTWKNTLENQTIPGLRSTLSSVQDELNNKLSATENEVKGWINDALTTYKWWEDNTIVDQIFHQSGWSDELEAYLQTVGVLDSDGNLNVSTITQTINSIDLRVRAIEQSGGSGSGDDDLITTLEAYCEQYIDNHEAVAQMRTMAAWLNENEDVIRWMTSGFKSATARDGKQSFAEMYAIDKTAFTNSIAEIKADVSTNQTDIGQLKTARTTMASQITDIENMTGTSTLVTKVTTIDNKLTDVEASLIAAFGENFAAVITKSNLNEQVAGLIASGANDTRAAILAAVQGDESTVAILADKVKIGLNDDLLSTGIDIENNQITLYGNTLINGMLTLNSDEGFILNNADGSPGTVIRGGEIPSYAQWTNGNSGQVNRSTDNHWVGVNNGSYSDSCSIDLGNYFNGNAVTINTIVITSGISLSGTLICKLKAYHGTDVVTKTITVDNNSLITTSPFRYAINVSDFSHSLTEDSNIIVSFDLSGTTTHTDDFQLNIAALATIEGANIGYIGSNGIALRAASVYDGPNYSYFGTALACIVHGQYGIKVGYDGITYSTDKGVTWTSLI